MTQKFFLSINSLFDRIENFPIGWRLIFLIAGAIILTRTVFEGIFDAKTVFSYWTLIFWGSWFFSLFICSIIFVSKIAKISLIKSGQLVLAGLPVILLPLAGLLFGLSRYFDFPQGDWGEIFYAVLTFAFFYPKLGLVFTLEIFIVLGAVFLFFYSKVSWPRALAGTLGIYGIIVFFGLQGKIITEILLLDFFKTNLTNSQIFAAINFFLLLLLTSALYFLIDVKKAKALIFNLRPERSFSFFIFGVLMFWSGNFFGDFHFINFLLGFALFAFLLLYAAISNDVSDLKIDKISNPNRPYARGIFTCKEMRFLQGAVLAIIFVLVLIIDSMPLLWITLANIGLSILYSVFRFRKFMFSYLIAAAGESTSVLYGYFSQESALYALSREMAIFFFAVFVFLAFFLPVKDLKDFEGDKKDGVRNFLTVFGWQKGKIITAVSVFCAYILFSLLAANPIFVVLSFIFAGLGAYFVIYYEKVREKASYLNWLVFIILFLCLR